MLSVEALKEYLNTSQFANIHVCEKGPKREKKGIAQPLQSGFCDDLIPYLVETILLKA